MDGLQIISARGFTSCMEKHPRDWIILAKMQGALYLYSLANIFQIIHVHIQGTVMHMVVKFEVSNINMQE